ncbi:hypothetical protein QFC22_000893 [Naganishia vaughanmartiniae]|uniref:Uncharacterized protein n=1 Tax=Naganishia vaughanmartiniae TaxID=1424756 RepID=A0ACC2XKE5_9TREE|nr:hypothetical protein QFC22_000893 [Naganishia vaughanmartiniae]
MAAQDGLPAEETASSLPSVPQDETLIASLKGNERATEQAGKEDLEEKQADSREHRGDEGLSGNAMDGEVEREAAHPLADAGTHQDLSRDSSNGEHGYTAPEGEVADAFKHDSHPAVPTAQSDFSSEQLDGSSNLDGPVYADPPVQAPIPVPASLQTTSAINRTSSPAYSQSSVTSGQGKDPSNVSTAPKKFSTVNINKKFLGKTGSGASPAQGSNTGASGNKDGGGLGLVNLSARPLSLTQQQSSSRILTSVKLTSVIPSKVSSATGGLTAAPAVGWAKSTLAPSAKGTPSGIAGAVSPRTVTPVNAALASTVDASLPNASTIRPMASATSTLPGSPHPPSPSVTPSVMPLAGIRLTNQGPSAARHLTSLTSAKQPIKRGWQTLSSSPASSQDAGTKESNSIGHGPFGQARFKQSLANDFPTAMEVIAGQKSAVVQAQQVAQAKAAHNQAILEGLNAFRGTNKDPNAHHWDEEDDEDMEFPQALDFGDGTTYTLPVLTNNRESDPLPATRNDLSSVEEVQQSENKPVFKHERFAKDDFDRSWPPKAQYGILPQEKARISEQHPNDDHGASTRTLYNARSNKMEPSFDRLVHPSTEMAPTQILPRSGREAQAGANAHTQEKQADMQTLERQTSRDRPWGRVQPPVTASDRNPWARRRPSETDHSRTWGPPHVVSDHQAWPRGHEAAKPRQMDDESRTTGGRIRSPVGLQSQLPPLFSQSHVTPVAITNLVVPAEMITEPIDITELQKDEMHRAAEQARLRRQQEEAEREAQKERARQKAKELAERELLKGTSRVLPSGGLPTAMAKPALHQKDVPPQMPKVIVKRTEPVLPQNSIARPTLSLLSAQRRSSDKRVAFEEPISQDTQRSPESIQRNSNSEFRTSQQTASTAYIIQRDPKSARSSNLSPVSEPSRGFSAFFDPLAESAHVATPAVIHFDDLPSFSLHGKNTTPSDMAKLALSTNARFNLRPELLQAESWRKSTRGQEVVVPGVIGSARESGAIPRVLVSRPAVQTVPDTLQTTEDLPHSPPIEVRVALPKPEPQSSRMPGSASDFPSLNANVGSAFDTVLARLQTAMTSSSDGGHPQTDFGSGTEIEPDHLAAPLNTVDEIEHAPRPLFLVLPRPNDFVFSMFALPPSPGPAWKRYTIRLPRSANSNKPPRPSRLVHRMRNEVPRGWTLSWDPPLELGSRNLSRDDWLTPKTYHRGKPVIIVKTPSQKFQPYVPPQEDTRPGESSSVTSQALKEEGARSGARKIIVKLPTGKARSSALSSDELGTAENEFVREEFQTSSEIPLLSPSSSSEHLPSTAKNTATTAEHKPATQSKAARRVPEGVAIAFARPHGESFSEDAEAQSSVRFMVSSEIEDDNLLSEVNKMSMDGLTDNPAAEDLHVRAQETEPRTPSTPSAHPRSASGTKSGPPSPNVTASTAWTSTATYSGAQSPGRKLPSREHLMNVWSHLDGDRGATQPSTVFRPLETDVATALSSSVQDLNEAPTSSQIRPERNEPEIDMDLPRYPSIHGAPPASDVDDHLKETNGQNYSNAGIDTAGEYQAGNSVSNGYDGYQYATLSSHMAHPPSNMPSPYSTRSPIDGMPNNIHSTNPLNGMSTMAPQHGVWMPLQQASNMAYSPGINSHGASTYGAHGMSKSPVSSGYDGTPILSNAGINLGQMPASTGGMYSHPSGPLDSPTAPYIRPSGYTSQPSHLSGIPNLYSQGGPYGHNGRDMYGMNAQYGPRGGMNQPMLPAGNREYSGRFNNSNTNSNRPFGGFNGGTTNSLGGSRYNAGVNGFGQPIAQGSQQHRAGLAGQGKVAANPGRKVW